MWARIEQCRNFVELSWGALEFLKFLLDTFCSFTAVVGAGFFLAGVPPMHLGFHNIDDVANVL
jgi:hypothetical protein